MFYWVGTEGKRWTIVETSTGDAMAAYRAAAEALGRPPAWVSGPYDTREIAAAYLDSCQRNRQDGQDEDQQEWTSRH